MYLHYVCGWRARSLAKHLNSLLAVALLAAAGCRAPLLRSVSEEHILQSGRYQLIQGIDLPEIESPRGCGPQALAAVLSFYQPSQSASDWYEVLPIRGQPTTPIHLLLAARAQGFEAAVTKGDWTYLKECVNSKRPALVMIDRALKADLPVRLDQPKSFHWVVVTGMSLDDREILLAATKNRFCIMKRQDFLERWSEDSNCTITIRPPTG